MTDVMGELAKDAQYANAKFIKVLVSSYTYYAYSRQVDVFHEEFFKIKFCVDRAWSYCYRLKYRP